jgi:thiol:disulfide interchange protein DsbC
MLEQREDITVYTFLLPVLGPASLDKAKAIWCSRDRDAAWRAWMQKSQAPTAQTGCDTSALERNLALGGKHAIKATPALVYEDGTRVGGAPSAVQLEGQLAQYRLATSDRDKATP